MYLSVEKWNRKRLADPSDDSGILYSNPGLLKFYQASESPTGLMKTHCWFPLFGFWSSMSGVEPENLHFWQFPRHWCCWSRNYTLRSTPQTQPSKRKKKPRKYIIFPLVSFTLLTHCRNFFHLYWMTFSDFPGLLFLYFTPGHGALWEADCNLAFALCLTLHLSFL